MTNIGVLSRSTMFRVVASSLRAAVKPNMARTSVAQVRNMSAAGTESDAEFDARYIAYFDRKDIDGWEIRKVRDQSHICLGLFLTETAGHG